MVYIKRVELSHFKSFGGTISIPFLPGFTVVSGPNGSGKSNILDALLFCLGLATSKGMRAERLPDLVNHNHSSNRNTAETSVSVTFDISDSLNSFVADDETLETNGHSNNNGHSLTDDDSSNPKSKIQNPKLEWTVSRRLRVTKGGSYTSTYSINGELCTASELHQQLNRLRIYPEGYNVVLQGDVTRIIAMNSKERREIIDELAGVAEFDRKIEKTKETLEAVRDREERCTIIATELARSLDRLTADRIKAEKYQKLKLQLHEKQQWEIVLVWKYLQQQQQQLQSQITIGETESVELTEALKILETQIKQTSLELDNLNTHVKALGEDEQLSVASQLANQKAKRHQLQQRQQDLETVVKDNRTAIAQTRANIEQYQKNLTHLIQEKIDFENHTLPIILSQRNQAREIIEKSRERANEIAAISEAWVQQQTRLNRKITAIQDTLNPQRTEQAQLNERYQQLQKNIAEQNQRLQTTEAELETKQSELDILSTQVNTSEQQIHSLAQQLATTEENRNLLQETQNRLLKEQREKQRQLDKLEATQQAQQEAQGTYATQVILQSDLPGICGLVAQLGQVETRFQLALETAAGGRLGYLVVEDDSVASAGIELLKQARAGRTTFLPLNKIKPPRPQEVNALRGMRGFVDLAVNLVNCNSRYHNIFIYVFGNTIVFETLNDARPHLGKYRMVTLEGELLETSGAMTGGSQPKRSSIHFGTIVNQDSEELDLLKKRLTDIEQILDRQEQILLQKTSLVKQLSQDLTEARQKGREQQLNLQQLQKEIQRLSVQKEELSLQLLKNRQELKIAENRLKILAVEIPPLESQLRQQQQYLAELEQSQTHQEWQEIQASIKLQESELQQREQAFRQGEEQLKELQSKYQRLEEKIIESQTRIQEYEKQGLDVNTQTATLQIQLTELEQKITETETLLQQLSERLGQTKKDRDQTEANLKSLQHQQQQKSWQLEKLQETQQERKIALQTLQEQLETQQAELPDTLPEIPESDDSISVQVEQLQKDIRNLQKRLEAMEPVNMLALEEYEKTQERLQELSEKVATIEAERTELLLRIETFTTLRFRAFKEAFDAVNENFQSTFATLSEGDGYLQLDDPENPFNGGLNLIAHPKGKPVQRLSSMSGGEKSLTALSFIFSLQRYQPSPFYAFDEVDMFLDGANVEKLSKMIQKQAQEAQFIVVSLRRPMIEASERTIGVTQARGAYTQVLGIKL